MDHGGNLATTQHLLLLSLIFVNITLFSTVHLLCKECIVHREPTYDLIALDFCKNDITPLSQGEICF